MEREFSKRVKEEALIEINIGYDANPRPIGISNDLQGKFQA